MHQCTKGELNQLRNGTVIGANACTHSPPTQTTIFTTFTFRYLSVYIALDLYIRQTKIYKLTDILLPHMYTLNKMH